MLVQGSATCIPVKWFCEIVHNIAWSLAGENKSARVSHNSFSNNILQDWDLHFNKLWSRSHIFTANVDLSTVIVRLSEVITTQQYYNKKKCIQLVNTCKLGNKRHEKTWSIFMKQQEDKFSTLLSKFSSYRIIILMFQDPFWFVTATNLDALNFGYFDFGQNPTTFWTM